MVPSRLRPAHELFLPCWSPLSTLQFKRHRPKRRHCDTAVECRLSSVDACGPGLCVWGQLSTLGTTGLGPHISMPWKGWELEAEAEPRACRWSWTEGHSTNSRLLFTVQPSACTLQTDSAVFNAENSTNCTMMNLP